MDKEFKEKLLKLYPNYDRVTGPYLRKDGRKHLCLNNTSKSKGDPLKNRTLSYPKALIEVKENRILNLNETVDHIDEDYTNDDLNNLQILSRIDNADKSFKLNPQRVQKYFNGICPECGNEFTKQMNYVKANNIKQGKAGPFCSRVCAGKYGKEIQLSRVYANGNAAKLKIL